MTEVFLWLLPRSITAGWIVLALVLLRLLLKRAPKWLTVALWSLVAIRLVLPISVESGLSVLPDAETVEQIMPGNFVYTGVAVGGFAASGSITPVPGASADPWQIWLPILTGIWVAGVAVMLAAMVISWLRLHRKLREAVRLQENIYLTEHTVSPFVFGIFRPRMYLPFGMTVEDMQYVIAHEKAHIDRRDHWWKPLGFLLLAVHWFHPLLWLAYILLCRDIELACDEKVIRQLDADSRADYSQALLTASISRRTITVCPLAFGEVGVKKRVKTVLNYKKPTFWIILIAVIACIVAAVCLLTDPVTEPETPQNTGTASTDNASVSLVGGVDQPGNVTVDASVDTTEPTHSLEWINEHRYVADGGEVYPEDLLKAVDSELQNYAIQDLPDGTLRLFSYRIYSSATRRPANSNETAETCAVSMLVLYKDYAIVDNSPLGVMDAGEQVLPIKITFGVEEGNYYMVDFVVADTVTLLKEKMPEAVNEILNISQSEEEARIAQLRQLCEEKLKSYLLGNETVFEDVSANSYDSIAYDLDGDGVKEEYYLGSNADSDIFTFLVGIRVNGTPKYQSVFSGEPSKLSFALDTDGVLICSEPLDGGDKTYFRVLLQEDVLVLEQQ